MSTLSKVYHLPSGVRRFVWFVRMGAGLALIAFREALPEYRAFKGKPS